MTLADEINRLITPGIDPVAAQLLHAAVEIQAMRDVNPTTLRDKICQAIEKERLGKAAEERLTSTTRVANRLTVTQITYSRENTYKVALIGREDRQIAWIKSTEAGLIVGNCFGLVAPEKVHFQTINEAMRRVAEILAGTQTMIRKELDWQRVGKSLYGMATDFPRLPIFEITPEDAHYTLKGMPIEDAEMDHLWSTSAKHLTGRAAMKLTILLKEIHG